MSKDNNTQGFEHLGIPYQKRLIAQFITDYKFANNIMDIINPNYFSEDTLRVIVSEIKDAFETNEVIPDIESLFFRLANRIDNKMNKLYIKMQLEEIQKITLNDSQFVQDTAMNFCKQQELKKSVSEIQKIIDRGGFDDYDECEVILKKALEVGNIKDEGISVFHNLSEVLSEDFRNPIATGINGLDDKMNGGLAKTELGVILAPFGVGKTTMITKIANHAFDLGHNVLQIFFEDTPKVIQRKHFSCWTKIPINDLGEEEHKEELYDLVDKKNASGGNLILRKYPSDGTTIPKIRQYIRKLIATGRKPDIILLDYIDCIAPSKSYTSEWSAEGGIMRQFETLISEFDMVGWTAIQGNRDSIEADTVKSSMIGGSIKKGQIGHFIVSIAKTLEQKENGRANMAILKSRFSIDGIVFDDILFDNGTIQIDIEDVNSFNTMVGQERKLKDKQDEKVKNLLGKFHSEVSKYDEKVKKVGDGESDENKKETV